MTVLHWQTFLSQDALINTKAQVKKNEIIAGLIETRKELLKAALTLSVQDREVVFLGEWSLTDLLAHLIGWDYTNLEGIKEILTGQLPIFLSRYDHDWQTYNVSLVQQYKKRDFRELISDIRVSHQLLIMFLRALPAEEMDRDRGLRAGKYKATPAWLLQFEVYDYDEKRHCKQIREFIRLRVEEQK